MKKIIGLFKKHKKLVSTFLTIVILTLIAIYLYKNREVFSILKDVQISTIIVVIAIQIFVVSLNALLEQRILKMLGTEISYSNSLLLQYAANFLNKILSNGGMFFRGYYLKKILKLSYSKYISAITGFYIINFLVYSVVGFFSLILIYLQRGSYNLLVTLFFVLLLGVTLFLVLWKKEVRLSEKYYLTRVVNEILKGWEIIKQNPKELLYFTFLTTLMLLVAVIQMIVLYHGLGANLSILSSVFMTTIGIVTIFINLTPDGIGIKEGIYMFSSKLIGVNSEIVLLGSLVARAIVLFPSILLGGASYFILADQIKKNSGDDITLLLQENKKKNKEIM